MAPQGSRSGFRTMPGRTDTHFHIFGPETKYPYRAELTYAPPAATPDAYMALAERLGIERAVIVQASVYGSDNSRQLDAMQEIVSMQTRAIVVVEPDVSDEELENLHDNGARGVRFIATRPGGLPLANLERIASRIRPLGWHVALMLNSPLIVELEERLHKLPCPFVIDHLADPDTQKGSEQPAFQALLRLLRSGNGWTKISAPYHMNTAAPHYSELKPLVEALLTEAPDRLLWATDWPHAGTHGRAPEAMDLLSALYSWCDEAALTKIMVCNPEALYGFG
ncbi:amidohydrolase family protein [Bradyrhizobium liaoningense]|uniref:amidohydrolase family protein n=1 Tax=Bradyrhizobium liaoningense TaxID=43992 RepID=UPI001BA5D0F1|nr:amidohydrolase family protein [Bradyrhizobium liaoningense]MBR0857734.1 amidohydrolase family protein [Bradyrhizobium liaoningense]